MTNDPRPRDVRAARHAQVIAAIMFCACALTMAVICSGIIVSGWFAGVIQDRYERFFWVGAVSGLVGVLVLGAAAVAGGRSTTLLTRIGFALFALAPLLCVGALIADFYG